MTALVLPFDGVTFEPEFDTDRLTGQLGRVYHLMKDRQWRTLEEIQIEVSGSQAGISARLRDLRKARFGGFEVERQRRGDPKQGLFEYRLLA